MTNKPLKSLTNLKTTLTARDRAERIIRNKNAPWVLTVDIKKLNSFDWSALIELIAAEIEQAVKDAVPEAREEGYKAGAEAAAKVVQKWIDNDCVGPNPAMTIRALPSATVKGEAVTGEGKE